MLVIVFINTRGYVEDCKCQICQIPLVHTPILFVANDLIKMYVLTAV